ncbi:MAG TPA: hypothetical protein DDY52_01960 [Candidatus Moranbacteria bacterium]|nr:hypothetical protein [Candidatus Moranbacteria bacterium]
MNSLGFYSDDAGFFYSLGSSTLSQTFNEFLGYVPGRNLHILWQKIIFIFFGWSPQDLPLLHLFQSICESLVAVLFYIILRRFKISALPSFIGTLAFLLWPTRNDVHFWISSLPMNIFSTAFFLLFIYTTQEIFKKISNKQFSINKLLIIDTLFYILALFTYDQVFFALLFILFLRSIIILKKIKNLRKNIIIQLALITLVVFGYLFYKTNYSSLNGGPTFSMDSVPRVSSNFFLSLDINFTKISMNFDPIASELLTNSQHKFINISFILLLMIFLYIFYKDNPNKLENSIQKNLYLISISVFLFLLAYLPVYIWYISPRHNYLPTIFIGSTIAGMLSIFNNFFIKKGPLFLLLWIFILIFPVHFAFNRFEENILKSSNIWATSYSLRKKISKDLIRKKVFNENTKCFMVLNAPAIYKIAPLYASEQTTFALGYFAKYPLDKFKKNNCERNIVLKDNCFDINNTSDIKPKDILAIKINDFNAYTDSKLTYSILNQCNN